MKRISTDVDSFDTTYPSLFPARGKFITVKLAAPSALPIYIEDLSLPVR